MVSNNTNKESLASPAYWVASVRARESERIDRLFDDPWAALLADQVDRDWLDRIATIQTQTIRMGIDYKLSLHWGKPGKEWGYPALRFDTAIPQNLVNTIQRAIPQNLAENLTNVLVHQKEAPIELGIVIRTKFFDEFLLHATREHEIRQIVILASGMDTRAHRLTWPEHTWLFEVDKPEVLRQKKQLLSTARALLTCSRWSIGADLAQGLWPKTLMRAGFDPHQTSVWLIEDLLFYLSELGARHLLDRVMALSAPGSRLGFTAVNREMLTSPLTHSLIKSVSIPKLFAIDEPEAFLAERGWDAKVVQPGEEGANFGRWPYPVIPRSIPNFPRTWFVTATKRSSHT